MDDQTIKKFGWLDIPKSIWYFIEKDKTKFIVSFSILVLGFLYDLVPVYVIGKIVDFFTTYKTGEPLGLFYFYIIFMGVSWAVVQITLVKVRGDLGNISEHGRTNARVWGFQRLAEFSLGWHEKENTGNKLQRIFTGSDAINKCMKMLRSNLVKIFTSVVGAIVFFAFADFKFIVIVFVYTAIFLYNEFYFSNKLLALSNEFNKSNQKAGGTYVESANNMLAIKALGSEQSAIDRVLERETASRDIAIMKTSIGTSKWSLIHVGTGIALIVFLYYLGVSVVTNVITIGTVVVFFTYFSQLLSSLASFSSIHMDLIDLKSDLGNMMPIFFEQSTIKTGHQKFPRRWDKIEIKNGDFSYPSGKKALSNVNLSLGRNEKLGIAGASGSGKSTLVKMLLGLYALEKGDFRIGDRYFYDIAHDDLIHNIAVVLQETELFNLSLRDNITGLKSVDADILELAIDISQLKDVLKKLPDGLDTLVGEKGYKLSGGERQRLGIARAICKNAPILLLDEATSALDSKTEKKIMDKLLSKFSNEKTLIIIAHRISTLKDTDRVVVFEEGSILEEGTYDSLVANPNSHLGQLYALQSGSSLGVTNA